MKLITWLRGLLRRQLPDVEPPTTTRTPAGTRGTEALRQARLDLNETKSNWPEVRAVAGSLRQLRERNHFAEQIQHIFEGGTHT